MSAKVVKVFPDVELSVADLHKRWKPISIKTVRRQIKRLGLMPCRIVGVRPRFRLSDVVKAETLLQQQITDALLGHKRIDHVLTPREARALAGTKKRAK